MSAALDFRNVNALWASVAVETLARLGVRNAVVSPGSRSTPLAFALARHEGIEAVPVLDERSAAFFALGLAKQHGRPVVLLCTSGTAGANYFPAVIEAQESGVPLLVVTADRPPEMRDCSSGQTIDQQKLFGSHVNFFHELAVPEPSEPRLAYLRQTMAHALLRTRAPSPGPVHLNAPFRDPLPPVEDDSARALSGQIDDGFFAHLDEPMPDVTSAVEWRPPSGRGLIVAGPAAAAAFTGFPDSESDGVARCVSSGIGSCETPAHLPALTRRATAGVATSHFTDYVKKVSELAAATRWPVLADALSPVRTHANAAEVVTCYDAILREPELARALAPEFVLCLGGWPTSKVLRAWLESSGAEIVMVGSAAANRDALHGRTRQLFAPVETLRVTGAAAADDGYRQRWHEAEHGARTAMDAALERETVMLEPKACWLLARHLPEETPVFVASSMPVRDVEYFWPANGRRHRLVFNRGANGIDGTLSTALGVAHGGRPSVLLTGDLALLHDANGFMLRPKFRGSLTIVLVNNRGGGIFEHLPVAAFDPPFEEFFATPQDVDFAKLCAAHGVAHVSVRDWSQFVEAVAELPEQGIRVLEVRTDRKRDAAWRKEWLAKIGAAARAIHS